MPEAVMNIRQRSKVCHPSRCSPLISVANDFLRISGDWKEAGFWLMAWRGMACRQSVWREAASAIAAWIAARACGLFFQQVEPTMAEALATMSRALALLKCASDAKPICSRRATTVGPTPFTSNNALRSSAGNGMTALPPSAKLEQNAEAGARVVPVDVGEFVADHAAGAAFEAAVGNQADALVVERPAAGRAAVDASLGLGRRKTSSRPGSSRHRTGSGSVRCRYWGRGS